MADLNDLVKDLEKIIREYDKGEQKLLEDIGQVMQASVKARMQAGRGVDEHGGKETNYKKLADSTIKSRQSKQKTGKLSSLTNPNKSNQIDTGAMHSGINYTVGDRSVSIETDEPNRKIAGYQEDTGRPTFYVSSKEETKIRKMVDNFIKKLLNKTLK